MKSKALNWQNPLTIAQALTPHYADIVCLISSKAYPYSGKNSIIAVDLDQKIEADSWSSLETVLSNNTENPYENAWFGALSYELKHELEDLAETAPAPITTPRLLMAKFNCILVFNHQTETLSLHYQNEAQAQTIVSLLDAGPPQNQEETQAEVHLNSNMSDDNYKQKVQKIINALHRGDLFQANLTRKFFGEFKTLPDTFALFKDLVTLSPSPYSAYMKFDNLAILSSSPEQFLQANKDGQLVSRPIKGTSARSSDPTQDQKNYSTLKNSPKDQSENLMIVDLMRHDFAKSCDPASVVVEDLFKVESFGNVHHMASTIKGQIKPGCRPIDAVKNAFPPGSMTGAPKIQAMTLCAELEGLDRGIYSGALGWFGGDGSFDLSVVIRTLIIQGTKVEFQVGGGVVVQSTPEGELGEMYDKASHMVRVLSAL